MGSNKRQAHVRSRYCEIDALRAIALALLILYHIFVRHQPFASMLMFLQYEQLLNKYSFVGDLLGICRVPVLFLSSVTVAGFVLGRRSIKELVCDRLMRIVPPLCLGRSSVFREGSRPINAPSLPMKSAIK